MGQRTLLKRLLLALVFLFWLTTPSEAAIAYVAGAAASGSSGTATATVNSTGANFELITIGCRTSDVSYTVSDGNSNMLTALTQRNTLNDFGFARLYYSQGGTFGSGHTATISGCADIATIAITTFSGVASSPFDVQNGTGCDGTTGHPNCQTGSVTPSVNNELVITGAVEYNDDVGMTIDSGFTLAVDDHGIVTLSSAIAYLIQTTATAENPTWTTHTTATTRIQAVAIATFKAASAPPASTVKVLEVIPGQ